MLDALDAKEVLPKLGYVGVKGKAITGFLAYLEKKLRARVVYDGSKILYQKPELLDLFLLAERLGKRGAILQYFPRKKLPDEPPIFRWQATFLRTPGSSDIEAASGASISNERLSLTIALSEAVERHVWAVREDYAEIRYGAAHELRGAVIAPESFAGLSDAQRAANQRLTLSPDQKYRWVEGRSLITKKRLWVPFQAVTGKALPQEPLIREQNSSGTAAHDSKEQAVLGGLLELIERDAFMITWLNQLTPPQLDLAALRSRSTNLSELLNQCARYRLQPHATRLYTDAPAYVVGVVLEDLSGTAPHITIGLKAHRDPTIATEGALLEALRIRHGFRSRDEHETVPLPQRHELSHFDRLRYWSQGGRYKKLSFLTSGEMQKFSEPWETDTETQHLERLIEWCRTNGYECASVSLTSSKGNPTPWHIERVVVPQLQPIYLTERLPHASGPRMRDVPKQFGHTARSEPFLSEPHPFV